MADLSDLERKSVASGVFKEGGSDDVAKYWPLDRDNYHRKYVFVVL